MDSIHANCQNCLERSNRSFRQGPTQTWLYSHRIKLVDLNANHVAKTKTLISCVVTAQLICAFVFTYAVCRFSDVAARISKLIINFGFLGVFLLSVFYCFFFLLIGAVGVCCLPFRLHITCLLRYFIIMLMKL